MTPTRDAIGKPVTLRLTGRPGGRVVHGTLRAATAHHYTLEHSSGARDYDRHTVHSLTVREMPR